MVVVSVMIVLCEKGGVGVRWVRYVCMYVCVRDWEDGRESVSCLLLLSFWSLCLRVGGDALLNSHLEMSFLSAS